MFWLNTFDVLDESFRCPGWTVIPVLGESLILSWINPYPDLVPVLGEPLSLSLADICCNSGQHLQPLVFS
jgi:hypothetical protein